MSGPVDPKVPDENILAASRALEVIGRILEDEALQGQYAGAPEATFNAVRDRSEDAAVRSLNYEAIPERTRAVLESMGPEGLKQLGRFGAALLADGMWFEVPGVGRCFIK